MADSTVRPLTITPGVDIDLADDFAFAYRDESGPVVPTSAVAVVRQRRSLADAWLTLTSEATSGARLAIDPVTGTVTPVVPASATSGPEWDSRHSGVWDLLAVIPGGQSVLLCPVSPVIISHTVTRR